MVFGFFGDGRFLDFLKTGLFLGRGGGGLLRRAFGLLEDGCFEFYRNTGDFAIFR